MLQHFFERGKAEAGVDEAGRGCLAGPVVAAAVILPDGFFHPLLNDSKKMNVSDREIVRDHIEKNALAWSVASCTAHEIDRINILNASILAMHRALDLLNLDPEYILVDGNRFKPYKRLPHACIVKGDSKFAPIAAASVLAKTHRDALMQRLHDLFPHYGWDRNKAYATPLHRKAIIAFGTSPFHRRSFRLNFQTALDF